MEDRLVDTAHIRRLGANAWAENALTAKATHAKEKRQFSECILTRALKQTRSPL